MNRRPTSSSPEPDPVPAAPSAGPLAGAFSPRGPDPDAPSLSNPDEPARRRALLDLQHTAPLATYTRDLRTRWPGLVPDIDPLDGGIKARVLLLLEKPGPQVTRTGFVSRDNPSPTSAAIRAFLAQAGLPRGRTILWNAIPAWNGTTRVTGDELAKGREELGALLALLSDLDTVILAGRRAQANAPLLPVRLRVIRSDHPSPQVRAAFPFRWAAIPQLWSRAAAPP